MNRAYPILAVLSLTAAFKVGCSQSVQVEDVTVSDTIVLEADRQHPSSLTIVGKGNIEGTAKISLMLEDKPYKTEMLSGAIDFEWSNDWYSEDAVLQYESGTAKSGNLTLKYKF